MNYVPRKFPPIIGITLIVLAFIGVFGRFSADRSSDENDILNESNTYNETSVSRSTSVDSVADIVYVTRFGKKYHLSDCRYIRGKDDLIEISVEKAENAGYEPCEVCFEK